ncbi:Hypothetical protein DHA2_151444 [Giardia duodenalis]|uniref:Uncharacterized protein n=1 Tax=Giardia intestinalis TaxID=5741 RepID=V6TE69_GIAIN|nr:Hypothetical protein DHA2_151444 [Giardia intestinalis]
MFSARPALHRQEDGPRYCGVTTLNPCRCCECPNWERHGCHCPPNNNVTQDDVNQYLAFERRRMARRALDPEWQATDPIENGRPCIDPGCPPRSFSQCSPRPGPRAFGEGALGCCGEVFDPDHPCCEACAEAHGRRPNTRQGFAQTMRRNPRCARGTLNAQASRPVYVCSLPQKAITFTESANARKQEKYYTTCPLKTTTRYVVNPNEPPILQTSRGDSWYDVPTQASYTSLSPHLRSGRIHLYNPYKSADIANVSYTSQTCDFVDSKRDQAYVHALQAKNTQRQHMLDWSLTGSKPAAHFHRTWKGNY